MTIETKVGSVVERKVIDLKDFEWSDALLAPVVSLLVNVNQRFALLLETNAVMFSPEKESIAVRGRLVLRRDSLYKNDEETLFAALIANAVSRLIMHIEDLSHLTNLPKRLNRPYTLFIDNGNKAEITVTVELFPEEREKAETKFKKLRRL